MKGKKIIIGIILLSMTIFISACSPTSPPEDNNNQEESNSQEEKDNIQKLEEQIVEKDAKIAEREAKIKELEKNQEEVEDDDEANQYIEEEDHMLISLGKVLKALEKEDIQKLSEYIHPEKGVRFAAYPNVDLEKDIVLKKDEIVDAFNDSKTYNWGDYDGKGDPIELSFKDYYKEFVYDEDFINAPIIGNNNTLTGGNTLDNVKEAYPNGKYAEMYFEVFEEQYRGLDWKSLKLVFEEYEGRLYLVGLIHGQWTI